MRYVTWQSVTEAGYNWSTSRSPVVFDDESGKLRGRAWLRIDQLSDVPSHILIALTNVNSEPFGIRLEIDSYPNRWIIPNNNIVTQDGIYAVEWPIQKLSVQNLCLGKIVFVNLHIEILPLEKSRPHSLPLPDASALPAFSADWLSKWDRHETSVCASLGVSSTFPENKIIIPARAVSVQPLAVRASLWGLEELKATGHVIARKAVLCGQINATTVIPIVTRMAETPGPILDVVLPIDALTESSGVGILTVINFKPPIHAPRSLAHADLFDSEKIGRTRVCLRGYSVRAPHPYPYGVDLDRFRVNDKLANNALFVGPGSSFDASSETEILDLSHDRIEPWAISLTSEHAKKGRILNREMCTDVEHKEVHQQMVIGWPLIRKLDLGVLVLKQEVSSFLEVESSKLNFAPVEGCTQNCNNRGRCETFVTASNTVIHLCTCMYGWTGRNCDIRTQANAALHNLFLIYSNLIVLVPVLVGVRYLHHSRLFATKRFRVTDGKSIMTLFALLLFCNVGWWSALYHQCGQTGTCFSPTSFNFLKTTIDSRLIDPNVTSEMFLQPSLLHATEPTPLQTTFTNESFVTSPATMIHLSCLLDTQSELDRCSFLGAAGHSDAVVQETHSIKAFADVLAMDGADTKAHLFVGGQHYPTRMMWAKLQRLDFYFAYYSIIFMCIFIGRFGVCLNLTLSLCALSLLHFAMRGPTVHESETVRIFLMICAGILVLGAFNQGKPARPYWPLSGAFITGLAGLLCWVQSWRHGDRPAYWIWHSSWHVSILLCPAFILLRQDHQLKVNYGIIQAAEEENLTKDEYMLEADERSTSAYSS